jgi:hypothetical protein
MVSMRTRFSSTNGADAMLRRSEFSILKEFKGEGLAGAADESDFDAWKEHIIFRCVVGSQAFGLSTDDSDIDRRGIYLPPAELHWSLYGVPEQIENNPTQEAYWELQKFLVMALKRTPTSRVLHTPLVEYATPLRKSSIDETQSLPLQANLSNLQRVCDEPVSRSSSRISAHAARSNGNTPCTSCGSCSPGLAPSAMGAAGASR